MDLYEKYLKSKATRVEAEEWNNLPNGLKYQNDKFKISIPHCTPPMLNRMGQQYQGGSNYWKSPEALNKAILKIIVASENTIIKKAINILKDQEYDSLIDCQIFCDELQGKINQKKEKHYVPKL